MRIYRKLIIAFLILSSVPTLIVGISGFYFAKNSLHEAIISNMHNAAVEAANEIEGFIVERKYDMIMLERQNVYKTTFSILDQFSNDPSNSYCVDAKKALDAQMAVFQMAYKYDNVRVIDKKGKVIYTLDPGRSLEPEKRIYDVDKLLQKVKTSIFICDASVDRYKESPYEICMLGAAYGKGDEVIGLIQLKFNMKRLFNELNRSIHLGESGEIMCAEMTPDNNLSLIGERRYKGIVYPEAGTGLGGQNILAMQKALMGESGSGEAIDYRGKKVLSSWLPIPSLGWGVVAKIDESEAFLPVDKLRNLLVAILTITVFLIILTSLMLARSLVIPINRLRIGAEIVGAGDLDYRIGVTSNDEIGQLSQAFDLMAQNLKSTTASINDLNKEISEQEKTGAEHQKLLKWQQGVNVLRQSLLEPVFLERKLKMITDGIVHIFGADFCRIWLIRPGDMCEKGCMHADVTEGPHVCRNREKCLHLIVSSGRYTHIDGREHSRVPFGCYTIGLIAAGEDHKLLTNDVSNDPHVYNHEWARKAGLVSFAGYQIKIPRGEAIGVLGLFAKHPISSAEDMIIDSFSNTTAFIVHQANISNNLLRKSVELAQNIEELKHSQKMLIQSEKMASLGKLVSEISHEINNPLMIISGNAQLSLMAEKMSAETKNTLNVIVSECQRAKDIIRRVLKFAKPSRGDVKKIDLCQSVETVIGIVEHPFKSVSRIEIKRKYLKNPPLVLIDEQQLQEVAMNILNNAKDAMPDGGIITITVSLEKDHMRIDFRDNGQGMSEETKQDVFEPFFTTKSDGTGLGLAICYGIIKAYGGELKFESELSKGTTFTLLLPIMKVLPT